MRNLQLICLGNLRRGCTRNISTSILNTQNSQLLIKIASRYHLTCKITNNVVSVSAKFNVTRTQYKIIIASRYHLTCNITKNMVSVSAKFNVTRTQYKIIIANRYHLTCNIIKIWSVKVPNLMSPCTRTRSLSLVSQSGPSRFSGLRESYFPLERSSQ